MKIPKYFNKQIEPRCEYCSYCKISDDSVCICSINRTIKNDKCSKFVYDPLMRVPNTSPDLMQLDPEDFEL